MSVTRNRNWLLLLRRLRVSNRKEIDREKYALMAIRGDFSKYEI